MKNLSLNESRELRNQLIDLENSEQLRDRSNYVKTVDHPEYMDNRARFFEFVDGEKSIDYLSAHELFQYLESMFYVS